MTLSVLLEIEIVHLKINILNLDLIVLYKLSDHLNY